MRCGSSSPWLIPQAPTCFSSGIKVSQTMSCPTMIDASTQSQCQLGKALDQCLIELFQNCKDDYTTMQTLKYRLMNEVAKACGLSFDHISHLVQTHVPVHPEVAEQLKKWCSKYDGINEILAQDYVEQDKLLKVIRYCLKNNYDAHYLLAMDGLMGSKLAPCMDPKRYLDNLRFGTTDTEENFRASHTRAVRKVHQEIAQTDYEKPSHGVYQVMCQILREQTGIELPGLDNMEPLESRTMEVCTKVYFEQMPVKMFREWLASLKTRSTTVSEDEESPSAKRKRVAETPMTN